MGDISNNFSRKEFECQCGCGYDTVDTELLEMLEEIRMYFDKPVIITSACRCAAHNQAIGGSQKSQHLFGRAADIVVKGVDPAEVQEYLEDYVRPSGLGRYDTFTHIDSRSGFARWEG